MECCVDIKRLSTSSDRLNFIREPVLKILHKITLSVTQSEQIAFRNIGVELQLGFRSFLISENDPSWGKVSLLVKSFQAVDVPTTKFTKAELLRAEYLGMVPSWHHGYPEPSDDNDYLQKTFDLSHFCVACGCGKKQIAPFRVSKSPIWGSNSVLQLNWIFDEYFIKPDVWSEVFKPFGIGCRPVVLDKTGAEIDSIVQLDIPAVVDLQLNNFAYEECSSCGGKKYLPVSRGFYPQPQATRTPIFKSSEHFGSGASANKLVLISSDLFAAIKQANLKGIDFKPCIQDR